MAHALPERHRIAHELSYVLHDLVCHILVEGERDKIFGVDVRFRDEADRLSFENRTGDFLDWFALTGRAKDEVDLVCRTAIHALLSDFCHFIYEALSCSRRGKLTVAFALLRKPLQEVLFLFEILAVDDVHFAGAIKADPLSLRSQKVGGIEAHRKRVEKALALLSTGERFDAGYLTQLRYDKSADDSFDGIANKATHLFTEHHAIRTEPMNINFIFSGPDAWASQWGYLYARLPYVLAYAWDLIELVVSRFSRTADGYVKEMRLRVMAGLSLWGAELDAQYRQPAVLTLVAHAETEIRSGLDRPDLPEAGELWELFDEGRTPVAGRRSRTFRRQFRRLWRSLDAARGAAVDEFRRG